MSVCRATCGRWGRREAGGKGEGVCGIFRRYKYLNDNAETAYERMYAL